jgi:hypothetical protein
MHVDLPGVSQLIYSGGHAPYHVGPGSFPENCRRKTFDGESTSVQRISGLAVVPDLDMTGKFVEELDMTGKLVEEPSQQIRLGR